MIDQRTQFVARRLAGEPMTALCEEFGISRKPGYKIVQRYKTGGPDGLTDRSRRPLRHAHQRPLAIEQQIVGLKKRYPNWGAPTIREKLRPLCAPLRLPAVCTVHAVLDRHGLVQHRRRQRPTLTATPRHHAGR